MLSYVSTHGLDHRAPGAAAGREYQNGPGRVASNELLDEYDETRVVVFCEARIMPRCVVTRVTGRR